MHYVELLRARRCLTWYCGVLLGVFALVAFSMLTGHGEVHGRGDHPSSIPLADVVSICAFGVMIVATCMAPGLNAESATTAITWTRPAPRDAIAWSYIAIDVLTMLIAYAFNVALVLAFLALFGLIDLVQLDGRLPLAFVNGFGCALMWYGLVTLVTARMDGRGGLFSGLSWAAFLVVGGLAAAPFPPLIKGLLTFLNYFNPLTYFDAAMGSKQHMVTTLGAGPMTLIAWGFVVVTFVATVRLWSTREV